MYKDLTIKDANNVASRTLEYLHTHKLKPVPENYAVLYAYYAQSLPDLVHDIDILQKKEQPLTEHICQDLYKRFIENEKHEEVVRRASTNMSKNLKGMSQIVKSVQQTTHDFNGTLGGVKDRLSVVTEQKEVELLVKAVLADTQKVMHANKQLEQQLSSSLSLMEDLRNDLENIRREAFKDSLTGLGNRRTFDSELSRLKKACTDQNLPLSLVMMDIDYFKSFNDQFGHPVGDQVLKLVAKAITEGIKGQDIPARYGGEEFAIILPETKLEDAVTIGNNLRRAVAGKDVINRASGEKIAQITLSAGVAELAAGESLDELVSRADSALYTAKLNGRNQIAASPTSESGSGKNTSQQKAS